jgi:hypothetical protein
MCSISSNQITQLRNAQKQKIKLKQNIKSQIMKKLLSTFGLLALMLVVTSFTTPNEPSGGKKPTMPDYAIGGGSGGKKPTMPDYAIGGGSGGKKPTMPDYAIGGGSGGKKPTMPD